MKKTIYSALVFGVTLMLVAFSPINKDNFNYTEINGRSSFDLIEAGSFQEAEHMKTLSDEGVWYKRYRVWTDVAETRNISELEAVIERN